MKNKILALLFFMLTIYVIDLPRIYANDQFMFLGSTDKFDVYLDTIRLTVTKDDNNQIYYDTWLVIESKQETQELNVITNQYQPLKQEILHIIFDITAEKKTAQIRSYASYTQNGEVINTYASVEPMIYNIEQFSVLCNRIEEYIAKMHIKPIAVPNEKYLSVNEKDFFNLFETRGYKINKIDEVQKYNKYNGSNYSASTSPYSFLDKVIEKEIHLYVAGDDKDHLKIAQMQFALEGPNYEQATKKSNLPSTEKMDLFYMMLQVLFPDWPKEESKKWIDNSITTMNQKNTLMFIFLHKGKEYIMISRQPVQGNETVLYVLKVSQQQPSTVNPFHPYIERNHIISVYEEWDTLQSN
jgi:hypothetical protein